ncbi:MAG: cofactor-independent phosphoglycerate mutase [Lachnospiraceae bacterium]|nr:cofactor-independent phosphoglycerate mutase [Lachnospiraceae bacterium]
MKYVIILGDGMADRPIESLGGKTPLEYAKTPVLDMLSEKSEIGLVHTIPEGMKPGSDTANLSVLGYDPKQYYSGRSPLEALSIGVDMKDTDVAIRTNIVTLTEDEGLSFEEQTILDHSSGEISTEDCAILLKAVREELENESYRFYVGTSYRHCLIWDKGQVQDLFPPHDHLGEVIGAYLPKDEALKGMMKRSYEILKNHPLNLERKKQGLNPANCLWFWGAGTKPLLSPFEEKTGLKGVMISAVDLLKGIAIGASMKVIPVEGANGGLHTNYRGKAMAAVKALRDEGYDFAYIHVEAPDEMGHQGSVEKKVESIEHLDKEVIGVVYEELSRSGQDFRMAVLPDHPTPIAVRTHTSEAVPYLIYDSTDRLSHSYHYNEREAEETGVYLEKGPMLMDRLLKRI